MLPSNSLLLGAAAPFLGLDADKFEAGIRSIFALRRSRHARAQRFRLCTEHVHFLSMVRIYRISLICVCLQPFSIHDSR